MTGLRGIMYPLRDLEITLIEVSSATPDLSEMKKFLYKKLRIYISFNLESIKY